MVIVKGNNGKALRRRRMMHGILCLGSTVCLLVGFTILVNLFFLVVLDDPRGWSFFGFGSSHRARMRGYRQHHKKKGFFFNGRNDDATDDAPHLSEEEILQLILEGNLQLIDLVPNAANLHALGGRDAPDYEGLYRGKFCRIDWTVHEEDPSSTPMFRDVIHSSECGQGNPTYQYDLYQAVQAVKAYDAQLPSLSHNNKTHSTATVHTLELGGVVFHESRCGSTLVANLMQLHNPQENIVYSESPPPIHILRFADSTEDEPMLNANLAATMLQDVIHLMSRSKDPAKKRVFFKIQSIGSLSIPTFRQAFPETPWIFVYRNPTEVLMSHLKAGERANCVQTRTRAIPQRIHDTVQRSSLGDVDPLSLDIPQYCAAHLATLTEVAARELLADKEAHGLAVNYRDLPGIFMDHILPDQWNIPVDEAARQRMHEGSSSYSKGRGPNAGMTFKSDTEEKQKEASAEVNRAAKDLLEPSFHTLEILANIFKTTKGIASSQ